MRSSVSKKVAKMSIEINKMHRELAKLQKERDELLTSKKFTQATKVSDINFPSSLIEELASHSKPRVKRVQDIRYR